MENFTELKTALEEFNQLDEKLKSIESKEFKKGFTLSQFGSLTELENEDEFWSVKQCLEDIISARHKKAAIELSKYEIIKRDADDFLEFKRLKAKFEHQAD